MATNVEKTLKLSEQDSLAFSALKLRASQLQHYENFLADAAGQTLPEIRSMALVSSLHSGEHNVFYYSSKAKGVSAERLRANTNLRASIDLVLTVQLK